MATNGPICYFDLCRSDWVLLQRSMLLFRCTRGAQR